MPLLEGESEALSGIFLAQMLVALACFIGGGWVVKTIWAALSLEVERHGRRKSELDELERSSAVHLSSDDC